MGTSESYEVFVSYAHADVDRAELFVRALTAAGFKVWWDPHLKPGTKYQNLIEEVLHSVKVVVVLWSHNAVQSDWVKDEAGIGAARGILVPVMLDDTLPPLGLRQIQSEYMADWKGDGQNASLQRLLGEVAKYTSVKLDDQALSNLRPTFIRVPSFVRVIAMKTILLSAIILVLAVVTLYGAYGYGQGLTCQVRRVETFDFNAPLGDQIVLAALFFSIMWITTFTSRLARYIRASKLGRSDALVLGRGFLMTFFGTTLVLGGIFSWNSIEIIMLSAEEGCLSSVLVGLLLTVVAFALPLGSIIQGAVSAVYIVIAAFRHAVWKIFN